MPSAGSRNGHNFVTANGDRMKNRGEAHLQMIEPQGGRIKSTFQVADVTRALYSVSKICDEGCVVTFDATEGVVTKDGKVITRFKREGGLYVVEMLIEDAPGKSGETSPFARQGAQQ